MKTKTKTKELPLVSPGEILFAEFLEPLGLSVYKLAQDLGVSRVRLNEIVRRKRAITPDTAVRLGKYFGTTAEFWINLQTSYELRKMEREGKVPKIARCAQLTS